MSMPSRSSTGAGPLIAAGLLVAAVIVVVAVLAAGGASAAAVWDSFFPPTPVTTQGDQIKGLYDLVFYVAVAIFLVVEALIVYAAFRYRRRPGDDTLPAQTHGNNLVEVIWTLIPTVIVGVLFVFSWQALNQVEAKSPSPQVTIRAVAAQFQWTFEYLDPASDDPLRAPLFSQFLPQGEGGGMVVPVGAPVHVTLRSPDVIHAFYVPRFLFKKDVVPGRDNNFEFTVYEPGVYRGQCAELCGTFHGAMVFEVRALPQAEYDAWFAAQLAGPTPPPSSEPQPSGGPEPSGPAPTGPATTLNISALGITYEQDGFEAPAGPLTIVFENKEAVPHDVDIRDGNGQTLYDAQIVSGPTTATYEVPPLPAGTYTLICSVHPIPAMTRTLTLN